MTRLDLGVTCRLHYERIRKISHNGRGQVTPTGEALQTTSQDWLRDVPVSNLYRKTVTADAIDGKLTLCRIRRVKCDEVRCLNVRIDRKHLC